MAYITGSKEQEDGQTFTSYSGFVDTYTRPYQYKVAQDIVRIVNRGNRDITVNVNGSNTVVNAGKDASFVGPISQFTVNTALGVQAFIAESWIKSTSTGGGGTGSGVLIVSTVAELLSSYPNGSAAPVWVTADNSWYYWSGELPTPDTTPPTVSISPTPGTFASAQSVTLTANEAATIYYTLDGSTPTTSSTPYSSAISVNSTTTLKYFAKDTAGNSSSVQTASYTIDAGAPPDTTAPNPVTGLSAGTPTSSSVPLSWTISNSGDVVKQEIAYSTDGTNFTVANGNLNPSTNSATVTGLAASTAYTFRLVAIDGAGNRSTSVTATATTSAAAATGKVDDGTLTLYQDNPLTKQTIANPDNYFQTNTQWTAFATIKPVLNTNAATKIFSRLTTNALKLEFTFDNHFTGVLYGHATAGTGSSQFPSVTDPATRTDFSGYYHVVFVRDSTKLYLYVNNALVHSVAVASDTYIDASTSPLLFGDNTQTNQPIFKNMGYYNRALTTTELTQNYNALK